MLTYIIEATDHCRRVESFLRKLLPAASLSYLHKLVKSGHITVNGTPASPDAILRLSDRVAVKESSKTRELLAEGEPELDVLFEDRWIVVFNKPAGLPMHRAAEVDDRNLVDLGGRFLAGHGDATVKLRPVNRLDRGTSGAVVMAKSSSAAGMFGRFVKEEGLEKLYLALVEGVMPENGVITAPVEGKEAETRFRRVFQGAEGALVALSPTTGRMHQIRQHLRGIGHPIFGDRRYGGKPLSGFTGHPLHSFRTGFTHPATGKSITITAPLPAPFLHLVERLAGEAFVSLVRGLPDIPGA